MRKTLIAIALVAVVALVAGPAAAGGKANGRGKPASSGGTLTLVPLDSTDGSLHWGQRITFEVDTAATKPSVSVACSQGGVVVYRASAGFYPEYPWQWAQIFTLRSAAWTGGDADCTAILYYVDRRGRAQNLASLGFHVYA